VQIPPWKWRDSHPIFQEGNRVAVPLFRCDRRAAQGISDPLIVRDLCATWKSDPGSAHWRFFGAPCPRSFSARKDDGLSAKREFRLCGEARRRRVEKCPTRGGITISKGLRSSPGETGRCSLFYRRGKSGAVPLFIPEKASGRGARCRSDVPRRPAPCRCRSCLPGGGARRGRCGRRRRSSRNPSPNR
jgi:hypothetical protein